MGRRSRHLAPPRGGRVRRHRYAHLHLLIELVEDGRQPVHGEALELGIADARKIGGGKVGQLAIIKHLDDSAARTARLGGWANGAEVLS